MSEEIQSETPLFQCICCETRFGFEYPPTDPQNVKCFSVANSAQNPNAAQHQENAVNAQTQDMKSCPKCGALNTRAARECYSCHIIFERLEGLPKDPSLKAQPSLVRKWKNLLENFENEKLHDEFIRSCHELDALRFATMKYEEIKSAQGGDPKCEQMLARIGSLTLVSLTQKSNIANNAETIKSKWQKYLYWGPFSLSAVLILLGMVNLGHRNLIGAGVALAFMAAGLIVMIKGKISLSDFLD